MNIDKKTIIGMCHLLPLPGEPNYNYKTGINEIHKRAAKEIEIMQQCGISAMLFSNEFGYPYIDKIDSLTQSAMSFIVGRLKEKIKVPFGVDCMYDSIATINIALATEADFIRLTLGKSDITDYMHGNTDIGLLIRNLNNYKTRFLPRVFLDISTPLSLIPEAKKLDFIDCIITQVSPYAICVSSEEINHFDIHKLQLMNKDSLIICDGGCNKKNIKQIMDKADGVIVGTALKRNEIISNEIDYKNAKEITELVVSDNK